MKCCKRDESYCRWWWLMIDEHGQLGLWVFEQGQCCRTRSRVLSGNLYVIKNQNSNARIKDGKQKQNGKKRVFSNASDGSNPFSIIACFLSDAIHIPQRVKMAVNGSDWIFIMSATDWDEKRGGNKAAYVEVDAAIAETRRRDANKTHFYSYLFFSSCSF